MRIMNHSAHGGDRTDSISDTFGVNKKTIGGGKAKIGPGSASLIFLAIAIIFPLRLGRTFCLGSIVLKALGLPKEWVSANATFNMMILYSTAFLAIGYVIGRIFKENWGAGIGRKICLGLLLILVVFLGLALMSFSAFLSAPAT